MYNLYIYMYVSEIIYNSVYIYNHTTLYHIRKNYIKLYNII
jgi:hypothetical protein